MNPAYDYDKLNLAVISFEEPDMSYEFNTLMFWATEDGRVYSASDAGCSCPIPFEDYSGNDLDEVLQKLERVGSVEQAERIFDSWNDFYSGVKLGVSEKRELSAWLKNNAKF